MFILDDWRERRKKLSSGINKFYFYMTEQQKITLKEEKNDAPCNKLLKKYNEQFSA